MKKVYGKIHAGSLVSIVILSLVIIGFGLVYLRFGSKGEGEVDKSIPSERVSASEITLTHSTSASNVDQGSSASVKSFYVKVPPQRPSFDRINSIEVFKDVADFERRAASGDGPAAVALLDAINTCYPLPAAPTDNIVRQGSVKIERAAWPECRNLPDNLAKGRLAILLPAIDAGSAQAKYSYATFVRQVFLSGEAAGSIQGTYSLDQAQRLSAKYAGEAGANGLWEGYAYLSKTNDDGQWGLRDPTLAYAYALAAAETAGAPNSMKTIAERLRSQLPPGEVVKAQNLVDTFR